MLSGNTETASVASAGPVADLGSARAFQSNLLSFGTITDRALLVSRRFLLAGVANSSSHARLFLLARCRRKSFLVKDVSLTMRDGKDCSGRVKTRRSASLGRKR
jgi:hypothetical protein